MSDAPPRPLHRGLDRLFRTTLLIIPVGVLGNVLFSLLVTDRSLLAALGEFPRGYLLLAVGLGLFPWLTNALRLLIWTRFLGYPIGFRDCFQISLGLDLGGAVSPIVVGGGFFKWGMLVQRGVSPGAAASLSTFPLVEDAAFFAVAIPVAVVLSESWNLPVFRDLAAPLRANAPTVLLLAGGIALATWLGVRWVLGGGLGSRPRRRSLRLVARSRRRLRTTWHDAREVFRLIGQRGKLRFLLTVALTGLQWTARYSVISALVAFLGEPVRPVLFWLLQWVVFTIMSFTPTPGAAGGAEAAFYFIYSPFLSPRVLGLATAGWRFLTFYLPLGLAAVLFFLLDLQGRRRRRAGPPA